jgi:hypothetical protein
MRNKLVSHGLDRIRNRPRKHADFLDQLRTFSVFRDKIDNRAADYDRIGVTRYFTSLFRI